MRRQIIGWAVVSALLMGCLLAATSAAATRPGAGSKTTAAASKAAPAAKPKPAKKPSLRHGSVPAAPPATTPPGAAVSAHLYLSGAFFVARKPVAVPDRAVRVGAVVEPYVPGQVVTLRAFLGKRLIKSTELVLKPSRYHTFGTFTTTVSSPSPGEVTLAVTHGATATQAAFSGERAFSVLDEHAGFGSSGPFVALIQQRLSALHFYIRQTGVYDEGTELALDAYHRLLRWGTYKTLDGRTISFLLNGWGQFKVRYPGQGQHVEANLSDQLLALMSGSKVDYIYPISSGKPSTPTVLGNFQVYARVPGMQSDGMYYSSYFIGGYAIHGYDPAPDYPASHGCLRLPMVDATFVYNWLDYGVDVDVYY